MPIYTVQEKQPPHATIMPTATANRDDVSFAIQSQSYFPGKRLIFHYFTLTHPWHDKTKSSNELFVSSVWVNPPL